MVINYQLFLVTVTNGTKKPAKESSEEESSSDDEPAPKKGNILFKIII